MTIYTHFFVHPLHGRVWTCALPHERPQRYAPPMRLTTFCLALLLAACGGSDDPVIDGGAGTADVSTTDVAIDVEVADVALDAPCATCASAIGRQDPDSLCDGSESQTLYNAINTCLCTGACAADCSASYCTGAEPSDTCAACTANTDTGCGTQFAACAADN
jgi:hypothetical protein